MSGARMKMTIGSIVLLLLVFVGLGGLWLTRGPSADDFANIKDPHIAPKANQRMLVIEAKGDPNVVGAKAFKALFQAYFKTAGVSKAGRPPAPRGRWGVSLSVPREQWAGRYALPVPESAAPPSSETDGLATKVETWDYGEVAEVLHVGPYSKEQPDIERLQTYIASHNYHIVGEHEEEYVKGPGMFFRGNPENYLTIIRLRVEPGPAK